MHGALQSKGPLLLRPHQISQRAHAARMLDSTDLDAVEIQKKLEIQAVLDKLYITLLSNIDIRSTFSMLWTSMNLLGVCFVPAENPEGISSAESIASEEQQPDSSGSHRKKRDLRTDFQRHKTLCIFSNFIWYLVLFRNSSLPLSDMREDIQQERQLKCTQSNSF